MCRLPDTLIIHLKRYSQSGVKITAPVEFPVEEFDMAEFTKLELGAGEFIYDLIGCVRHEGSYGSGYYTGLTNNNGVWYLYDDSRVTEEMPSNICYAQAYILFYRGRAVSPLSTSISDTDETSEDKHVPLSEEQKALQMKMCHHQSCHSVRPNTVATCHNGLFNTDEGLCPKRLYIF